MQTRQTTIDLSKCTCPPGCDMGHNWPEDGHWSGCPYYKTPAQCHNEWKKRHKPTTKKYYTEPMTQMEGVWRVRSKDEPINIVTDRQLPTGQWLTPYETTKQIDASSTVCNSKQVV